VPTEIVLMVLVESHSSMVVMAVDMHVMDMSVSLRRDSGTTAVDIGRSYPVGWGACHFCGVISFIVEYSRKSRYF